MRVIRRVVFYWVVFAGGAVLLALEILASRLLAPSFGNSVYVWGSIISVFLAALASGYVLGGWIADRTPTMSGLAQMVALAGVALAALELGGARLVAWMGDWTGGAPAGTLLAAAVLFGPVSVLLATISPYAIRLAAGDLARIGGTAGGLYAISTVGSLAGALGCTFGLIPFMDLERALAWLLVVTATTALAAALAARRPGFLAPALAVLLALFGLLIRPLSVPGLGGLVYQRTTPYQTLRVWDRGPIRYLESDRVVHGAVVRADGEVSVAYVRALPVALLLDPRIRRVLVLGMGAGGLATYLQERRPGIEVDLVDVDAVVPEVARRFMGFQAGPRTRVHVADARRFVARSSARWDLVVADTYIGRAVPFHLTTVEFLREVRRKLAPEGVFALNLAAGLNLPFPRAMVRTLAEVFPCLASFRVPASGNVLVLGTAGDLCDPPRDVLARRIEALDGSGFDPPLATLADLRIRREIDLSDAPVLSDRFAPVEHLIELDADAAPQR